MLAKLAADALRRKKRLHNGDAERVAIWAAKEFAKENSAKNFWHFWAERATPHIVELVRESKELSDLLGML